MKKSIISIITCLLAIVNLEAQNGGIDNIVGTNHIIDSKILNEERQIQIYLPPNYEDSNEAYPVLYILDGQRFFLYAVSLSQSFKQFKLTPEFIIVGINNSYPQRFQNLGDGKEKFMEFIKSELTPYIENKFRAKKEKLLFGWEFGGSLVFNTMLSNPSLFNGYIIASPYPIMDKIKELNSVSELKTSLYFAVSPDEYEVKHSTEKLDSLLTKKNISGLDWSYLKLDIEKHRSTGYPTLYHGIRNYFKYYQEFETNNIEKFINSGGLNYALNYTKERALRHGFEQELSLWSRHTIIRSAIRAKDFYHFETLLHALNRKSFVNELISNDMDYAASDIAAFYEKNKSYNKAIEIYKLLLEKHPSSERLLDKIKKANKALDVLNLNIKKRTN